MGVIPPPSVQVEQIDLEGIDGGLVIDLHAEFGSSNDKLVAPGSSLVVTAVTADDEAYAGSLGEGELTDAVTALNKASGQNNASIDVLLTAVGGGSSSGALDTTQFATLQVSGDFVVINGDGKYLGKVHYGIFLHL